MSGHCGGSDAARSGVYPTGIHPDTEDERSHLLDLRTLAAACGLSVRRIMHHAKLGTMRLDKAKEKIPGVGVVFKAGLAERFITTMRAKHRTGKPASDDRTVTVQLTREETERWLRVLSAALSAAGMKPGE